MTTFRVSAVRVAVLFSGCLFGWSLASVGFTPAEAMENLHDQRREGNRICFSDHFHQGSGIGKNEKVATAAAVLSWREFTAWEYGDRWGDWRLANSKEIKCDKEGGQVQCLVWARPCRRR